MKPRDQRLQKLIVLLFMHTRSGFICSGSICSDRTSGLVNLQSDHIVTHIPLSLHFRTYISFIISGYSYYVNMLVTRLKSDMCLVFLLHN